MTSPFHSHQLRPRDISGSYNGGVFVWDYAVFCAVDEEDASVAFGEVGVAG